MADADPLGAPLVDVGPAIDKALDAWAQNVQARRARFVRGDRLPSHTTRLSRRAFCAALRARMSPWAPHARACALCCVCGAVYAHTPDALLPRTRVIPSAFPFRAPQPRVKQVVSKLAAPREIVEDTQAWVKNKAPAARHVHTHSDVPACCG
jgi:hypothetical protein